MVERRNSRSPNTRGKDVAARSYAGRHGGAALSQQFSEENPNPQMSKSFVHSSGGLTVSEDIFPGLIQT